MLQVISVECAQDYQLKVELSNGESGIFDMKPYLDKGVFKELQDLNYFKRVSIDHMGGICWPHEQDLSAHTLASELI